MFTQIKAVIFDLDDTLYLQRSFKESGFREVALWLEKTFSIPFDRTTSHLNHILNEFGPSYPFMFDRLCERIGLQENIKLDLIKVFLQHDPQIECFPGVLHILYQLSRSFRLGLLTDGREETQRKKVESLNIANYFSTILYSDSVGLGKPAAPLYEFFERQFTLHPQELVYIGDNPKKDFVEANTRGWLTVRVLTGEYAKLRVENRKDAKVKINSVPDLLDLIDLKS